MPNDEAEALSRGSGGPARAEGGAPETHRARIAYANEFGLYVAVDSRTGIEHAFTLDMVTGYDGRDPKKYGIERGRDVELALDQGKVVRVSPLPGG